MLRILLTDCGVSSTFVGFSLHPSRQNIAVIRFRLAEQLEKKQFRDSRRITMQEVAEATQINRSTLSKLLNQKGYSTGTDVLDRLCAYFECQISDLVEYVPE